MWKIVLKLVTAVLLIVIGFDKFIDIVPNPYLEGAAKSLFKTLNNVGYILPFIGVVQVLTGLAIFFKRSTPLGALMLAPLSLSLLVFYIVLTPSAVYLSLYLFVVSCLLLYDNRAFYSPIILSLTNGRTITFLQLKKSHFTDEELDEEMGAEK